MGWPSKVEQTNVRTRKLEQLSQLSGKGVLTAGEMVWAKGKIPFIIDSGNMSIYFHFIPLDIDDNGALSLSVFNQM